MFSAVLPAQELEQTLPQLTIVAPAAEGGGWDLTARAMQDALEQSGSVETINVVLSPGAGGLIALAQFLEARRGRADAVIIGGSFMLGAAALNQSSVSLLEATPIARLTADYAAVAVPSNSPYKNLDDLLLVMQSAPESLSWVGGSVGGPDQQFLWRLAQAMNIDPDLINYQPRSGGGDVSSALSSGRFAVGISGYGEFAPTIEAGDIRVLAVAAPHPLAGTNLPTLEELGVVGVSQMNWRGVFAAPDITPEEHEFLVNLVTQMVQSTSWQETLAEHRWDDAFLGGDEFKQFLRTEEASSSELQDEITSEAGQPKVLPKALVRRYSLALILGSSAIILLLALYWVWIRGRKREGNLIEALRKIGEDAKLSSEQLQNLHSGISAHIENDFERWELTPAEKSVAQLLLKGMRLKEIARSRKTSERTVRQQAQSVYQKAGLDGRTDLAAYFLEDYLPPTEILAKNS